MDEPVRRRNFVRLVATDAVQIAGRVVALSGVATGMVAQGVASLAEAVDPSPQRSSGATGATPAAAPSPAGVPSPAKPLPGAASRATAPAPSLDAAAWETLARHTHASLAANRHQVGPLINRYPFRLRDGVLRIETRASSAMAQAVRRDPQVTLLLDDADTRQRLMIFGQAELLEGGKVPADDAAADDAAADDGAVDDAAADASIATNAGAAVDPERARIVIRPTHAVRTPL